jgi:hypothetical protein
MPSKKGVRKVAEMTLRTDCLDTALVAACNRWSMTLKNCSRITLTRHDAVFTTVTETSAAAPPPAPAVHIPSFQNKHRCHVLTFYVLFGTQIGQALWVHRVHGRASWPSLLLLMQACIPWEARGRLCDSTVRLHVELPWLRPHSGSLAAAMGRATRFKGIRGSAMNKFCAMS